MAQLVWTNLAERDLREISGYIALDSQAYALAFASRTSHCPVELFQNFLRARSGKSYFKTIASSTWSRATLLAFFVSGTRRWIWRGFSPRLPGTCPRRGRHPAGRSSQPG